MSAGAATSQPLLACGNCREPMQRLTLDGHYGRAVDLDLCRRCDLVWFDGSETAQLAGPGLLALIGAMAGSQVVAHEMLRSDPRCPRCRGTLAIVHNQSRWGRSTQLQCARRDGAYQSFAQFLGEKGLLRPMSRADRAALLQRGGRIDCVNCGGEIAQDDERCRYCLSIPSLLDVARLARALDPLDTIEPPAVYRTAAKQSALQCAACGVALAAGRDDRLLAVRRDARDRLARRRERGRAGTRAGVARGGPKRPSPDVVKRRLAVIEADLPRQRAWAADMQAEADARLGRNRWDVDWEWLSMLERTPVRIAVGVAIAFVVWFIAHFGKR